MNKEPLTSVIINTKKGRIKITDCQVFDKGLPDEARFYANALEHKGMGETGKTAFGALKQLAISFWVLDQYKKQNNLQ